MNLPPLSLLLLLFSLILFSASISCSIGVPTALPLSTSSRWIVDGGGRRVKLACVNWAAHLEPAVAEGLGKRPLDAISRQVVSMGFNCVRLTWSLYLLTNASLGALTVRRSLAGIGLAEAAAGVLINNPDLLDLSLVQAYQAVVSNLASNNIMVILDNQNSKPGWCCSRYDGNGFFGDEYFDPDEWLQGLKMMATMFKTSSNVIGMSLRNELRGPSQNLTLWYRYMQRGAEVVHSANPGLLVILSGLDYDKDLSFLAAKPVQLSFPRKLVFELHWYGFSDGGDWGNGNPNEVCASVVGNLTTRGGFFLLKQGWPLFLSEFGVDQGGRNVADNRFLSCFLSVAAELDLDWALWALQGSYYIREGQIDYNENYGVLSKEWAKPRNYDFLKRLAALQSPFQGPGLSNEDPYNVIYHPMTGLCVIMKSPMEPLHLGQCADSQAWNYTTKQNIILKGLGYCLQAEYVGKPAKLGTSCGDSSSKWELISDSKMHISSKLSSNGSTIHVCLDVGPNRDIFTNTCKCLRYDGSCSPESQWFKIVKSNRELESKSFNVNLKVKNPLLMKGEVRTF